jgi:3-dehydroquinate synthase
MQSVPRIGQASELLNDYLGQHSYSKVGVLVDENTHRHCLRFIAPALPKGYDLLQIPSGEIYKNLESTSDIWSWMTEHGWDRHAILINLGGGVIGDMGGFAAATYKRGISFVNLPTTLLSMVDASIGGKLGIDFQGFKNHIGLFQEPNGVFIDAGFLATLPLKQLKSGFAEVVKHALIASPEYWDFLKAKTFPHFEWEKVIKTSVHIKSEVVDSDPTEQGRRKILNFGHTLGHAIETYFLSTERMLLHGEAIAMGMVLETELSEKFAGLSQEASAQIRQKLLNWFGDFSIPKYSHDKIVKLCMQDKKNRSGLIRFSLLQNIGEAVYDVEIPEKALFDVLNAHK